jgi:hypothetical protein
MADDPRTPIHLRLRRSSVDQVDTIAQRTGWDRSTTLRTLLAIGLRAWERGERP